MGITSEDKTFYSLDIVTRLGSGVLHVDNRFFQLNEEDKLRSHIACGHRGHILTTVIKITTEDVTGEFVKKKRK